MDQRLNLWDSREKALKKLSKEYPEVLAVMEKQFGLIDECSRALFTIDSAFGRVCALTLAKARNLGQSCYSLDLDSLAQESGALFRPLIETLELLKYFRLYPDKVDDAIESDPPKAGKIAGMIGSEHEKLRKYLNEHASHISLRPESTRHLLDFKSSEFHVGIRLQQPFRISVTLTNLHTLYSVMILVGFEAVRCAQDAKCLSHQDLAIRMEGLREYGSKIFDEARNRIKNTAS